MAKKAYKSIFARKLMENEPVLFIKEGNTISGTLFFPPTSLTGVMVHDHRLGYKEINFTVEGLDRKNVGGKDEGHLGRNVLVEEGRKRPGSDSPVSFKVCHGKNGGGTLLLQANDQGGGRGDNVQFPFLDEEELTGEIGAPGYYPSTRDGKRALLFSENGLFHSKQVLVTYEHENWDNPGNDLSGNQGCVPGRRRDALPSTREVLARGEPLHVVVLGDSISCGCDSSGYRGLPPFNPPYPDLVVNALRQASQSPVTLQNESIGGTTSSWGRRRAKELARSLKKLEKKNQDLHCLAIIAFGMNDASGRYPPRKYRKNIERQARAFLDGLPRAECILVASSLPNPEWNHANEGLMFQYLEKLHSIASKFGDKCQVVDMTSLWKELLRRKRYLDITGNGINHPNDFGHRLHAVAIGRVLGL